MRPMPGSLGWAEYIEALRLEASLGAVGTPCHPSSSPMPRPKEIFIVAHDGGCEGYALPSLAFWTEDEAHKWAASQEGCYSVARVPIYPEFPSGEWFRLKPLARSGGIDTPPPK